MPFAKKTNSQGSQPAPAGVSPIFIGRTGELLFFVHNILQPEAPTHNILSISGQGGVGKSTLLARFIAEAHKSPFEDYCLTAFVDERQTSPISMMEQLAQQLHLAGKFEKALKQYKQAVRRRQIERETLSDRLFESVPDVAGAVFQGLPLAGPLLGEGTKVAASHLLKEHQSSQMLRDTELLATPIDELTRAFVTELNRLADANVTLSSTGRKRERRIMLFFDTFEQLAAEATPWLLDHFLAVRVSGNVVLVVAGRDPIERTSPDDPKRWLTYCNDGTIYWISLNSFTEDETRMYLAKQGITDADQMSNIWHLSRGLPLFLGLLTSNPHGDIDPTKDVVVNFLRWIPERERIKRQLALDASLFSRPFNQDDLEVFSYVPESDRVSLFQWLTEQPFVRSSAQDGRYLYHDVARDLLSRHLYQRSQKHYEETRRVLAIYYQGILEKTQTERGNEVYYSSEWLELVVAIISQLLLLPDQTSHIKAIEYVLLADEHTFTEQEREITRALRDLAQEPSSHHISPAAQSIALQLSHYVEPYQDRYQHKQEWLAATGALLEKVRHVPSFPSGLLANIYINHAQAYRSLGNEELASEDFQQALRLYGSMNHAERGWVHFYRGNYQEALACHNQALEQNPRDAAAYIGRGWAYYNLGEEKQAIADFEHARELDPNVNPGGRENGLRWTYYGERKYQQALAANDYLLKRDPGEYTLYAFQIRCFLQLKDYQRVTNAYDHVFELAPNRAEAYVVIGWEYFYAKSYQESLAYHNQALEQNSRDAAGYIGRGWAYYNLGEYDRAIADFEHARGLDPNVNPVGRENGLRWAYYRERKYQQALVANDYYLKRNLKVGYFVFRSRCFRSLKDYSQSIDACNHALELAPKPSDAYFQRGLTYLWLKDMGQAQADFVRSCELKPTKIEAVLLAEWVGICQRGNDPLVPERLEAIALVDPEDHDAHVCLGIALLLRRNLRMALAELEQALLSTFHEEWTVHFWKGITSAFLARDEEAIASIVKALDLELPPILLAPLHWFEQERPGFYGKYAAPLLAKYE